MRTALVLLFLLTLAALPGSLVPQRSVDPLRVQQFAARAPDAVAVVRAVLAVRGLLGAVVRGDLPAALRVAGRLRAAAQPGALGSGARPPAGDSAEPDAAAGSPVLVDRRVTGGRPGPRSGGAARGPLPRRRPRRDRSPPSAATGARPATWSSTSRCCCCSSVSRWAASSASRPTCSSSRAAASPTRRPPTTPSPVARSSATRRCRRSPSTWTTSRCATSRTATSAAPRATSAPG